MEVKALLKNSYLWVIVFTMIAMFISSGLGSATIYFARYILGNVQLMAGMQLASYIPMLIGLFTIAPLIKKYGKRKCILAGAGLMAVGSLVIIANPASLPVVMTGLVIKSIGMAPWLATIYPMVLDTIEYGDWKTGVRSEGLIVSTTSVASKFGTGIGAALVGWILAAGSYVAGAAIQTHAAAEAIQICFMYLPAILAITCVVLLSFYKLDAIYPQIAQELHERDQSKLDAE